MPIHIPKIHVASRKTLVVAAALAAGCAPAPERDPNPPRTVPGEAQPGGMRAFASDAEFAAFLRQRNEALRRLARKYEGEGATAAPEPESATAPVAADATATDQAAQGTDESVTNVQHAGVDEGGIVKVHGDYLVMLRRGRLFTVAIGGGALRPVSAVDAYAAGIEPSGDWYDEMLISGDQVIVIGYSYSRGGTEVGLFRIAPDGGLTHTSTYHMRSNDYYSSRNYASRLIEGKLVFYTPLYLHGEDPDEVLPAIRRWRGEASRGEPFEPIVSHTRIYRPERSFRPDEALALHTVTVCGLEGGEMQCQGTAVVGPPGRVFYVSPGAVYAWLTQWNHDGDDRSATPVSIVYRMPLDGSGPSALGVAGGPVDQFSFLESGDGHLNVVVRAEGRGDGMWDAERDAGKVSLLRVPVSAFGDGSGSAPASSYRPLPTPAGHSFQNRFVGEHLLYGTGSGWMPRDTTQRPAVYAVRWAGGEVAELALPHGVDRIEAMGPDAVVVGSGGADLHFTGVRLGARPTVAGRYTLPNAAQGELRSHGFFYRAEDRDSGMLGLPVSGPGRPGYEHLFHNSASILFLRNEQLRFEELGRLAARAEGAVDDGCRASCVDWYGNARPLFLRGRIFALLGYELVEGALDGSRIRETRRVSYAPRSGGRRVAEE